MTAAIGSGCQFGALRRNLEKLDQYAFLKGTVSRPGEHDSPIVVLLYTANAESPQVVDSFVLLGPGPYFFEAPTGNYRVAAFEDKNESLSYEAGSEPVAFYGEPTDIVVSAGDRRGGLDLSFRAGEVRRLDPALSIPHLGVSGIKELPSGHLGTIVSLDDPSFSEENGQLGLWQPADFLFDIGAGIYFLEAFDENKIPVLFMHGATGHPGNWTGLIDRLDRERFQPWLFYYPSAIRLEIVAQKLHQWLQALYVRHGFQRLGIVAHSMGGLVARSLINQIGRDANNDRFEQSILFVSISTPWAGHAAAELGLNHAPVPPPSWIDMAPGSLFLSSLFAKPSTEGLTFYLFFSYKGRFLSAGEAGDHVVTLTSQLRPEAQRQARKIYGFDETHVSILQSNEVSHQLNDLLAPLGED